MEGLSLPLTLNNGKFSIFANGLLGLGSQGVPSTRAHSPTLVPVPIILCRIREWACIYALANTIDSLILTPGPIVVFGPILTLGPSCKEYKFCINMHGQVYTNHTFKNNFSSYNGSWMYSSWWMNIYISYNVTRIITRRSKTVWMFLLVKS